VKLGRGAVIVVELDPTLGHEQHGVRPCVVVSDPEVISDQRFPLVCIVPIAGTPGDGLLYPPPRARKEWPGQEVVRTDRPSAISR
jgi:mRNA-degrading endonuclease toxin of MazEF toxin-antitoxin module